MMSVVMVQQAIRKKAMSMNPTTTLSGTTAATRDNDGTTDAGITLGTVSGVLAGDTANVTAAPFLRDNSTASRQTDDKHHTTAAHLLLLYRHLRLFHILTHGHHLRRRVLKTRTFSRLEDQHLLILHHDIPAHTLAVA